MFIFSLQKKRKKKKIFSFPYKILLGHDNGKFIVKKFGKFYSQN